MYIPSLTFRSDTLDFHIHGMLHYFIYEFCVTNIFWRPMTDDSNFLMLLFSRKRHLFKLHKYINNLQITSISRKSVVTLRNHLLEF